MTSGDLADNSVTGSKIDGAVAGHLPRSCPTAQVTTSKLANEGVTRGKIAPGLLAYWAVVANDGTKTRSEPSGITSTKIGSGTYAVTFPAAVDQCAYQVSIASPGNQPPTPLNNGVISAFAQSAVTIEVRTYSVQVSPPVLQDRPFHVTVNC